MRNKPQSFVAVEPGRSAAPSEDGRQSATALAIARGTGRLLATLGFVSLPELTLPGGRRADLAGISPKGEIWIIEIKSSIADFRADQKWPEYAEFCDRFLFAVDKDFPAELIPGTEGLIVADRFGAEIVRPAEFYRMAPASRKTVTLAFARASAARLYALHDPQASIEALQARE